MQTSATEIRSVGEFGAIDRLTRLILARRHATQQSACATLIVDTGDDAAAWRSPAGSYLFTTDTMVEGVHFTRATLSWKDVGWKAMAVNVSDLAAMGGRPLYALVTLGLPGEFPLDALDAIYAGMLDMAEEAGFSVIGGDMVRSPTAFVSVALVGTIRGEPMTRTNAASGDLIAVTGPLGSSAGGLALLQDETPTTDDAALLLQAHRRPQPHLAQGQALSEEGVSCAMDISDGLLADLTKLCHASNVAAQVEAPQLPIHPALPRLFPETHLRKALSGGEDYVLLFAAPPEIIDRVIQRIPDAAIIGRIMDGDPGRVRVLDEGGNEITPTQSGWDHYR